MALAGVVIVGEPPRGHSGLEILANTTCGFQTTRLSQLPAPRIAAAVEAGYHHNPIVLHLEEYAIWKAPHSRPPTIPVHDSELQRMYRFSVHFRGNRGPSPFTS